MKQRSHAWFRAITQALGWLVMAAGAPIVHAELPHTEAAVEAAYLFRFCSYIEWPAQSAASQPFVIDVVGDPDVARELRHLIPAHSLNGRGVQVREIASARDVGDARIVYVGPGNSDFLQVLSPKAATGILIVTHEENGLDLGAMLNFVTVDNRVRFEISLTAADRAHLKISADLLSVAIRVHGGGRQSDEFCIPFSIPQNIDVPCDIREAHRQWLSPEDHDGSSVLPLETRFAAIDATV